MINICMISISSLLYNLDIIDSRIFSHLTSRTDIAAYYIKAARNLLVIENILYNYPFMVNRPESLSDDLK
jgi:hypothetical protein